MRTTTSLKQEVNHRCREQLEDFRDLPYHRIYPEVHRYASQTHFLLFICQFSSTEHTTRVSDNTCHQMVYLNGEDKDGVDVELELIWDDDNVAPFCCMFQPCRLIFNAETIQPGYWYSKIFEWPEVEGLGHLCFLTSQLETWHGQVGI